MSSLTAPPPGTELLDDPAADPEVVRRSLGDIARSNRWFGGAAAVRFALERVFDSVVPGTTLNLIDIGTGLGDLPRSAARWAAIRGFRLRPVGFDRHPAVARCAADLGLPTAVASGATLPLRDRSVDLVLVSQVIHHLDHPAALALLRECARVTRRALIVADLRRHRLAAAGFWLGARLLGFDPLTRTDGVTSVRRGYTPGEFADLFRAAGLAARTWSRPGFRLVAIWEPAG